MTTPRRPLLVLALLGLLLVGAAGCGVDSKDAAGSADTAVTTPDTRASDDQTTTTERADDETTTTERADDETTTTERSGSGDSDTPSIPDDQRDQIVKIYTDLGLPKEKAECLVDALFDQVGSNGFDPSDTSAVFDFLDKCDISLSDLGSLGGSGN